VAAEVAAAAPVAPEWVRVAVRGLLGPVVVVAVGEP